MLVLREMRRINKYLKHKKTRQHSEAPKKDLKKKKVWKSTKTEIRIKEIHLFLYICAALELVRKYLFPDVNIFCL